MKKFALAAVCTFALVGLVMAEEFGATITKIEGGKVTYVKGGKKGVTSEPATAEVSSKLKVAKGVADPDTKGKFNVGDEIKGALKADEFKDASADKAVNVRITIADDGADKGKITQILLVTKKAKKGGD
jgi:hypothetical protein